jgi:hypothetical protein
MSSVAFAPHGRDTPAMGERVRVVRHDGGLAAAKQAREQESEAVRAEARVLLAVQGPGVVELIGLTDAEPPALLTRWVGSRSLAEVPVPVAPEQAAALCLAVADVLGRLHRAGVVHGAVEPSHVLLDPDGRPVLCGFGSAGPIGAPVRRRATEPGPGDEASATPGGALRPALDVAGLGRLLDHLVGPGPGAAGPGTGWSRAARRARAQQQALRRVAAHATADDATTRPSISGFARAVRRAVPEARLHDETTAPGRTRRPTTAPDRPRRRGRVSATLALLAVVAATYFGLSAWWAPSTVRRVDASPVASRPPTTATTAPIPSTTASSAVAGPGPVVDHDGRRYQVGRAGDVVAVGPWLCDGRQLPAVLHPADGTVHLFDGWAADGGSLSARLVATVPGATALEPAAAMPDCSALAVTGGGTLTTLTPEDLR